MKGILRTYIVATTSLYFASLLFSGIIISGGLTGYLTAGAGLTAGFLIVRPILTLITLPLNVITFGLFSLVVNILVLYIVDILLTPLTITAFTVPQFSFLGITVSSFYASILLSYLIISATIYALQKAILWLFDEE